MLGIFILNSFKNLNNIKLNNKKACILVTGFKITNIMKAKKYLDKIIKDAYKEYVPKDRHASDSQSITFRKLRGILDEAEKEINETLEQLKP